jgi:hypothetical protein
MAKKPGPPQRTARSAKRQVKQTTVVTAADLGPVFLKRVFDLTLSACIPVFWRDGSQPWPKPVTGASAFVLSFAEQLVLVTAAHVFRIYEADRKANLKLVCQLRLLPFDLCYALIRLAPF